MNMLSSQTIEVKTDLSEIYVSLDYTDLFYHPLIKLTREAKADNKPKDKKSKILGANGEVKATEVNTYVKNRVTIKYSGV